MGQMKFAKVGCCLIFVFCAKSVFAENIFSSGPPSLQDHKRQAFSSANTGENFGITEENYRTLMVSPSYLGQIEGLQKHGRKPTEQERGSSFMYRFCDCVLNAVLDESPNRKTYFFTPYLKNAISALMLTVWYYKRDGASIVNMSQVIFNIKIHGSNGNFSLSRSSGERGGILSVIWYKSPDAPEAVLTELVAKINNTSAENIKAASEILSSGVSRLDRVLN